MEVTLMSNTPERDIEAEKMALDHAWEWFSLHATQRLQSVYFYLVAIAFLSAAFVTATKDKMYVVASVVAILASSISYFFYRMERRIRSLLHAAEDVIGPLQDRLSQSTGLEAIRIVSRVEDGEPGEWKYSKVFRYLYVTTGAAFVLGLLYVSWAAWSATPEVKNFPVVVHAVLATFFILCGYEMLSGLPRVPNVDCTQVVARWLMVVMGGVCIVLGIVIACHLVFCRL
jgi:hypothetical protein